MYDRGIVRRVLVALLALLLLSPLAGAIGFYIYVPYLERRMSFHPVRYDPRSPWQLPPEGSDVALATSDGVRLHGWFLTATGPRTGITVLTLHGNAGTIREMEPDALLLQKRGFDVFLIDYRGYGKSEGRTLDESTLKLDGAAAMDYLTRDRRLDPATIALYGYSMGTTVATDLAVALPCRAVALVAPLGSARLQAERVFPRLPGLFYDRMRNRFDNVGSIGRARCPVLVVHGDRDEVISVAHGRAVYEAAPQPKRLVIVPGGRHWLASSTGRGYVDELAAFFATPP